MSFYPMPNSDTKFFWEGTKNKELRFKKCKTCGTVLWPPSIACPKCHSTEFETIVSKGKGRIYSFAVYRVAFDEYFKDKIPYVVGIVELDEGIHFLSNIVNCEPSLIECGMQVQVIWEPSGDFNIPKFEPISGG
ncbi:Zn-ribbon domain-containing OB-fold protein [Hippea alviniae]|uniref:Zn-ribbon domain-containing OB-fold protein n=1 Tax=Hippea alviniae TaxID=1279027 RepID=UPI0003B6608A|nr:Zn-ribbon domain-containing OB-fold protein [Hippea alviniae]